MGGILGGVILALIIGLTWPHKLLLLEVAHPIVAVDTTVDHDYSKEEAYWLTPRRLLLITADFLDYGEFGYTQWKGHADQYDTVTKTRTRLDGLTNLLNQAKPFHGGHPFDFEASPLGTRLLWSEDQRRAVGDIRPKGPVAATIDGKQLRSWENGYSPTLCFWLDEQHFWDPAWDYPDTSSVHNPLMVYDASEAKGDRFVPTSGAEVRSVLSKFGEHKPFSTRMVVLERGALKVTRRFVDSKEGKIVDRSETVEFPPDTDLVGYGDTISTNSVVTCLLKHDETPPLLKWLHRFLPSIPVKSKVTEGLWVQREGIEKLEEVGHVPVQIDQDRITGDQIEQVKMLPDGKQVSFVYRAMLYVVPLTSLRP